MSQPLKKRKIVIEVTDEDNDLSIIRNVDKQVQEMKKNEAFYDEFLKTYNQALKNFNYHIERRADNIVAELTARNNYSHDLVSDCTRAKAEAFGAINKLPTEVFLLPGVESAEKMKEPFNICRTNRQAYLVILTAAYKKIEALKD